MPPLFIISLDFELAWGMEASKAYGSYRANILGARKAIPRILALSEKNNVQCTWATVGLLFFDDKDEMIAHIPEHKPRYASADLFNYRKIRAVGRNEKADPLHFGLSLLKQIKACPGQEIAGHTFSHYYCLEDGDDPVAFREDLAAAARAAERIGIRLQSLVFPYNQVREDYLPICRAAGYRAYRGTQDLASYRNPSHSSQTIWTRLARAVDSYCPLLKPRGTDRPVAADQIVNVRASRFLRPAMSSHPTFNHLQLKRIKDEMTAAAKANGMFHLWWHPHNFGRDTDLNLRLLQSIFDHNHRLSSEHGMVSATMRGVADAFLAPKQQASAA